MMAWKLDRPWDPVSSAADLKFLQRELVWELQIDSGTRIIYLPVPVCFRSSCQRVLPCITNFGSGALVARAERRLEGRHGPEIPIVRRCPAPPRRRFAE